MPRSKPTIDELKKRLELCREFGVVVYQETDKGFSFQLGPQPLGPSLAAITGGNDEVLTVEERNARRLKEFRRVATMHNPAARSGR